MIKFCETEIWKKPSILMARILVTMSADDKVSLTRPTYRCEWESMSDENNPQMLAMHCWISEGQSKCDEWGSARIHQQGKFVYLVLSCHCAKGIFVSDPFSVHYRKEAARNKERPDKTWQGVTFLWNLLPLSNGGKNMEYWQKPVGEKQGWGQPNYNGL